MPKLVFDLPDDPDPKKFGRHYWVAFHKIAESIPCNTCRTAGMGMMKFFHDLANAKLGKPIHDCRNFAYWKEAIAKVSSPCSISSRPLPCKRP